jgi:hypothetical protein
MRQTMPLLLAFLPGVDLACAQEAPTRKSGLWESSRTSTDTENQPRHIRACVDQANANPPPPNPAAVAPAPPRPPGNPSPSL